MAIRIALMTHAHAEAVVTVAALSFPEWEDSGEMLSADQFRHYVDCFPDGQFVALTDEPLEGESNVVGYTISFRTNHPIEGEWGYYYDFVGRGWWTHHEPDGEWLYGVDMGVIPAYRGRGLARQFYEARSAMVRRLNLRGELIAGLIPGYAAHRAAMPIETYVDRVLAGELFDPTLSVQLRNGFHLRRLLRGYVLDDRSDHVCTLMTKPNPEYREKT
ncbi:MAG: GNAT family N-acetyltransferase [Anaerolineae bacterium]